MRVLILGASGFIGGHAARAFARAGWSVRAGARDPAGARRRAPGFDWVRADFGKLSGADCDALLEDVDTVVNCVGVLQDGGGDKVSLAHVAGPRVLIAACERRGVRRLVHLSAVGADQAAHTAYASTKLATEQMLEASSLDYVILRPSLVLAAGAFGGTALMRGLAAFPGFIPLVGGDQRFRPIWAEDLAKAVVQLAATDAPSRLSLEVAGPEAVRLADLLRGLRSWLGLSPAPVLKVPAWAATPVLWLGDLAGLLGWPSALRTTSFRQMTHNVEGNAERWAALTGATPLTFEDMLAQHPATSADRWQAKLYFVRPVSVILLGLFWLATGLISLGPGWDAAMMVLLAGGYGEASTAILAIGGLFDVAMGLALFHRAWTGKVAILMALATLGYLAAGTLSLPHLWRDPLGPWLKVVPMMALCLFVAATEDRR